MGVDFLDPAMAMGEDRRTCREAAAFPYVVDIQEPGGRLAETYKVMDDLEGRNLLCDIDWIIDMRGGLVGYSTFYFKSRDVAVLLKLSHVSEL